MTSKLIAYGYCTHGATRAVKLPLIK